MGDRLHAGKLSRYVTSHPGQLSLAIPLWVGAMSTSLGWEGNRRSDVALAMRHSQQWFIHLRAQRPMKGRWAPRLCSFGVWPSFTFSRLWHGGCSVYCLICSPSTTVIAGCSYRVCVRCEWNYDGLMLPRYTKVNVKLWILFAVLWAPERSGSGVQVGCTAERRQQSITTWLQLPRRPVLVSMSAPSSQHFE